MPECGGCPEYERRVEIYTDSDKGCGDEFYVPPPPEPEPTDPTTPGDGGDGGDGGTTPTSGKYIASSFVAIASIAILY